jgi:hypothetical protein
LPIGSSRTVAGEGATIERRSVVEINCAYTTCALREIVCKGARGERWRVRDGAEGPAIGICTVSAIG